MLSKVKNNKEQTKNITKFEIDRKAWGMNKGKSKDNHNKNSITAHFIMFYVWYTKEIHQ